MHYKLYTLSLSLSLSQTHTHTHTQHSQVQVLQLMHPHSTFVAVAGLSLLAYVKPHSSCDQQLAYKNLVTGQQQPIHIVYTMYVQNRNTKVQNPRRMQALGNDVCSYCILRTRVHVLRKLLLGHCLYLACVTPVAPVASL